MAVRLFQNVMTYSAAATHATNTFDQYRDKVISVVDLNQAGKVPDQIGVRISITGGAGIAIAYGLLGCWDSAASDVPSDATASIRYYYLKEPGDVSANNRPTLISANQSFTGNFQVLPLYVVADKVDAYAKGYCTPYMGFVVDKTLWAGSLAATVTIEATG